MIIDRARGIALVTVLWFLAGMSLLVSGIVYQARIDTQMAQLHLARATAMSAGDGAILLMLADLVSRNPQDAAAGISLSGQYTVGAQVVSVAMVPTDGLVNLNLASAETLAILFSASAQYSAAEAKTIADNMVVWRDQPGQSQATGGKFQSTEDALQVAGMTRSLWDSIRDSVVVHGGSAEGVAGDSADAHSEQALSGVDSPNSGTKGKLANAYRVDAIVSYGGRTWLRRKWAVLGGGLTSQLPWRFSRVEAPRVLTGDRPAY